MCKSVLACANWSPTALHSAWWVELQHVSWRMPQFSCSIRSPEIKCSLQKVLSQVVLCWTVILASSRINKKHHFFLVLCSVPETIDNFTSSMAEISSPLYGSDNYVVDTNCLWHVTTAPGTLISVESVGTFRVMWHQQNWLTNYAFLLHRNLGNKFFVWAPEEAHRY